MNQYYGKYNKALVNEIVTDNQKFWRKWNACFSRNISEQNKIEGCIKNNDIYPAFANYFASNYVNSDAHLDLKNEFWKQYEVYATKNSTINDYLFSIDDVQKAILKLDKSTAPWVNCWHPEHLIYAVIVTSNHLCLLFNACIVYGCVLDPFTYFLVLVVKDKLGDSNRCANYKPIKLVTMFSKMFKSCLSDMLLLERLMMIYCKC